MDAPDLDPDPERQIAIWLDAARQAAEPQPDAMALATVTASGDPGVRMVILRGVGSGLVFYTDRDSQKGQDLRDHPRASALLHWHLPCHRQIRVTGPVEVVSEAESDAYWASRPPGSRLSATASRQSEVIAGRRALEDRVAGLARRYGDDVPRPARWGGYRLVPEAVEFWEEGPDRLHDRIRFRRDGPRWLVERLSP